MQVMQVIQRVPELWRACRAARRSNEKNLAIMTNTLVVPSGQTSAGLVVNSGVVLLVASCGETYPPR